VMRSGHCDLERQRLIRVVEYQVDLGILLAPVVEPPLAHLAQSV
jgi:hypothetical protein